MDSSVVIVGLGYVGLPLAREACRAGLSVTGLDLNRDRVNALNSGVSHVDDLTDADVKEMISLGFVASADTDVVSEADVAVVCVPTPLSPEGGPDLSAVIGAMSAIGEHLHEGMLVVLESTTYPGTTDEIVRPLLESNGLVAGTDFHLAFSPERIDPGNKLFGAKNTPKVVGGFTPECASRASSFYGKFIDVVVTTRGTREAEMAKLLENTYRHVNIALVNEMARFCHDLNIDLWDVIDAAKSKPFGFQAFYPGPGVGGHCIPIDPNYLSHNVQSRLGYPFRFVELAQEVNSRMPGYVVERAQDLLNDVGRPLNGSVVLLLGVTYKADIADERESPAISIAKKLLAKGARVQFSDPYVTHWKAVPEAESVSSVAAGLSEADLTILLQSHSDFDLALLSGAPKLLLDTRGVVSPTPDNVHRL